MRALAETPLPAVSGCMPSSRTRGGRRAPRLQWLVDAFGGRLRVRADPGVVRDRLAKWRAIRQYASQLPLLAMKRSLRRGPHTLALAPEPVAWADDRAAI